MRLACQRLLLIFLSSFFLSAAALASETPPGFADLVEKLTPSVVNISTTQKMKAGSGMQLFGLPEGEDLPPELRDFFDRFGGQEGGNGQQEEREVYALGSGFIIDENGYIATNNHVIADAEEITVILSDDTKLKAKIVGRDPKTDLALLKVDPGKKLPAVTFGDSDKARVGDWIIAIGNPFGLGGTVTAGIISARARNINAGPFDDFIQTDAPINRGNSGGPMFNMKGEVIGINTAIFSPSASGGSVGIGFAVPSSLAKSVFAQLKAKGHIDRGWLGVQIQDVTDEIADSVGLKKTYGALVMEVAKGSPSEKAGIVPGDIITRFDGKEVKEMRNLPRMVADTGIGKTVEVGLWHKGTDKTVSVTIGEMKEDENQDNAEENRAGGKHPQKTPGKAILGMSLAPLSSKDFERYGLPKDTKGLIIAKIKSDSEAAKHGLQPGDVIVSAGETELASQNDLEEAVKSARKAGRRFLLLRVQHGKDSAMFVALPLEESK